MNCPVCDTRLRVVERYGVEVDICPDCKGVWLDRGELDKILEMYTQGGLVPRQDMPQEPRERFDDRRFQQPHEGRYQEREHHSHDDEKHWDEHGHGDYDHRTGKRRRESWFGQIFDAFGGGDD